MTLNRMLRSCRPLLTTVCLVFLFTSHAQAEEVVIDWKTLPEYMAMDRDGQRGVIMTTQHALMRQMAATDYARAECIAGLFDVTEEGNKQFYDLKGLLRKAAEKDIGWKAQHVVVFKIEKLCPKTSQTEPQVSKD